MWILRDNEVVMVMGLALSRVRNCNVGQTLDEATVSDNWTIAVHWVVLERKKK